MMISLLLLKTENSTGPIRLSQRHDIPRMHFTGVNMLILAWQPMTAQEPCSRWRWGRWVGAGSGYAAKTWAALRAVDKSRQRTLADFSDQSISRTQHYALVNLPAGSISTDSCDLRPLSRLGADLKLDSWKGLAVVVAPQTWRRVMLSRKSSAILGQSVRCRRRECTLCTRADLRVQHANAQHDLLVQGWFQFCLRGIG